MSQPTLFDDAFAIWSAGVERVRPRGLLERFFAGQPQLLASLRDAPRVHVVGGGKAGAAMAEALEAILLPLGVRLEGSLNVPAGSVRPLAAVALHAARPDGSNHPTRAGVEGCEAMLARVERGGPDDVVLALISGGGSALMPAPVAGVSLEDKQAVTRLLHTCGADIAEMNCVRKHLSRFKGGGLARASRAGRLVALIISDVIGDPLEVIASGPTAADPSTFADAFGVLARYDLLDVIPPGVSAYLRSGMAGDAAETLKALPDHVENHLLGSNAVALGAAAEAARARGYAVVDLGPSVDGPAVQAARNAAAMIRAVRQKGVPASPPVCILSGGETTVQLTPRSGKGGRNQHWALAISTILSEAELAGAIALSAGTDGEDGPTDAAGGYVDAAFVRGTTLDERLDHLHRQDAYPLLARSGHLIRTGLTETNVMDLRVILLH